MNKEILNNLEEVFNNLKSNFDTPTEKIKVDLQNSSRELGQAIVNIRNSIMHTNNRKCINENISVEDSKRFLIMIDLFIDLDKKFFEKI